MINTKDLQQGNRLVLKGDQPKYPASQLFGATFNTSYQSNSPTWMDTNGVIWGTNSATNSVCKSEDYGSIYTDVLAVGADIDFSVVLITNSGKILVVDNSGNIKLSDTNYTTFTIKGVFGGGGFPRQTFAVCQRGDVIILGEYGSESAINPKKQVWASFDDGETFSKIFDPTLTTEQGTDEFIHIHDVEFDPWTSTIWVASGDSGAKNIWYSHDFGATWVDFYGDKLQAQRRYQPTQIWAFQHGIVFGTDEQPDGLRYLPKKKEVIQPDYNYSDLVIGWRRLNDSGIFGHIFNKRWTTYIDGEPTYLMPVAGTLGGFSRILASRDGIFWHEIYKFQSGAGSLRTIVGPHTGDTERRVVGSLETSNGVYTTFVAKMPKWY